MKDRLKRFLEKVSFFSFSFVMAFFVIFFLLARERAPAFLIFENFDIICGQGSKTEVSFFDRIDDFYSFFFFAVEIGSKLSSKAFTRIQSVLLTEIDRCAEDRSVIPLVTVTNLAQID